MVAFADFHGVEPSVIDAKPKRSVGFGHEHDRRCPLALGFLEYVEGENLIDLLLLYFLSVLTGCNRRLIHRGRALLELNPVLQVPYRFKVTIPHAIVTFQERDDLRSFRYGVVSGGHLVHPSVPVVGFPLTEMYGRIFLVTVGGSGLFASVTWSWSPFFSDRRPDIH